MGANPLAMQIPIGSEANFRGVVDLMTMQAIYWDDEMGREMRIEDIPADMRAEAEEARATWSNELPNWMMN